MPIIVKHLEENEIMSSYSPNVKQNDVSNCVMLELDPKVLNHAREVASRLTEKYYENGGDNPNGYATLFDVLTDMLDLQLEQESEERFSEEPFLPTSYSEGMRDAVKDAEDEKRYK